MRPVGRSGNIIQTCEHDIPIMRIWVVRLIRWFSVEPNHIVVQTKLCIVLAYVLRCSSSNANSRRSMRLNVTIATGCSASVCAASASATIWARYTARTVLPEPGGPTTNRDWSRGCSSTSSCSSTLTSSSQVGSRTSISSETEPVLLLAVKQGVPKSAVSRAAPSLDFDHAGIIGDQLEVCAAQRITERREAAIGLIPTGP